MVLKKGLTVLLALVIVMLCGCSGREDFKEVYRRQGIQALDEGNIPGAIEAFNKALSESRGIVKDVDYDINYYLGYSYYLNGDYAKAI